MTITSQSSQRPKSLNVDETLRESAETTVNKGLEANRLRIGDLKLKEAIRLERVARLLGDIPKLKRASAITFTEQECRAAAAKATREQGAG